MYTNTTIDNSTKSYYSQNTTYSTSSESDSSNVIWIYIAVLIITAFLFIEYQPYVAVVNTVNYAIFVMLHLFFTHKIPKDLFTTRRKTALIISFAVIEIFSTLTCSLKFLPQEIKTAYHDFLSLTGSGGFNQYFGQLIPHFEPRFWYIVVLVLAAFTGLSSLIQIPWLLRYRFQKKADRQNAISQLKFQLKLVLIMGFSLVGATIGFFFYVFYGVTKS